MPHYKRTQTSRYKTGGGDNTPTRFGSYFAKTWCLDKIEVKLPFYVDEYTNGYPSEKESKRLDAMLKKI